MRGEIKSKNFNWKTAKGKMKKNILVNVFFKRVDEQMQKG